VGDLEGFDGDFDGEFVGDLEGYIVGNMHGNFSLFLHLYRLSSPTSISQCIVDGLWQCTVPDDMCPANKTLDSPLKVYSFKLLILLFTS